MNCIINVVLRPVWPRIFIVALLVAGDPTPFHAQDFTSPPRAAAPCRFCPRIDKQIEPRAGS